MHARPILLVLENLAPGRTNIKVSIDPMIAVTNLVGSPDVGRTLTLLISDEVRALVETLAVKVAVAESNKNAVEGNEHVACLGAPEQLNESCPKNPFSDEA
jgi:hypothetical protein